MLIIELIKEIEKRPAMYIGKNYISCLKSFLDGWCYRGGDNAIDDIALMGDFQSWIVKTYNIKTSHSWASVILFYSNDECDALKNFFKEFNKFLDEREIA